MLPCTIGFREFFRFMRASRGTFSAAYDYIDVSSLWEMLPVKMTLFLRKQIALIAECLNAFLPYCDVRVIDIDQFPELANREGIWVTPTVFVQDGNEVRRFNYFDRRQLMNLVEERHVHPAMPLHSLEYVGIRPRIELNQEVRSNAA
jgi:hypothetical protein